ncbi:hypothetical protein BKN38_04200 [Helicobacter sp. CLO-3]|uniref:hypothetical protein n=1 Tax=unclassified Helicobacter TaxID=2593540 RepID=UPI000804CCD4|nr:MULTISPECIES: hypothetical protein [unclassified Helicobacter]OBV29176.1 hypothetical protein BA723_00855 [Helicobacter sp. CLO-3]OHU84007.1 hypothetical protein BKN38_04200 [Helicobacter sp. CLO-3]
MKVFKILYIFWVILFIFAWILSPVIGHNPNRLKEFFIAVGWIILPLIVLNLWLFFMIEDKKYLKRFFLLLLYYPLALILFIVITRLSFA